MFLAFRIATLNEIDLRKFFFVFQLVKPFGLEADRHLLRCLFSNIDFGDSIQVSKNSLHAKLLTQELTAQLNKSSLITNICFAIDNCFPYQKVSHGCFLTQNGS